MDKNPADELRRTASDDENYGYGKDLREFEMSQGENKWQKKNSSKKLGDRELKDFSKTVVVIDERFDEELTGPAEKSNISLSVRGNKRDKNQTGSSFMGSNKSKHSNSISKSVIIKDRYRGGDPLSTESRNHTP